VNVQGIAGPPHLKLRAEVIRARNAMARALVQRSAFDDMKAQNLDALQDRGFPFAKRRRQGAIDLSEAHLIGRYRNTTMPAKQLRRGEASWALREITDGKVRESGTQAGAPLFATKLADAHARCEPGRVLERRSSRGFDARRPNRYRTSSWVRA